jgi:hypothetical protein
MKHNETLWTCGRGHVMGLVVKSRLNGKWTRRLHKFRHALPVEKAEAGDVDAVLEGTAFDIVCDACPPDEKLTRTWWQDGDGQ